MTDFRDDGAAALEWAARYLERVDELPVLAQVKPGELTAKLPGSAPEQAERVYQRFCAALAAESVPVERGVFGARMTVGLVNDGPVTIVLDA